MVAQYRIRVGRRIGSAALEADGIHARTDGVTSLLVLIGAVAVALGAQWADAVVGLVITAAILIVGYQAAQQCRAASARCRRSRRRVLESQRPWLPSMGLSP